MRGGIFVSHQLHVKDLLEGFGMDDCKPISTPMDSNMKLSTQEDICFPVGLLAGFMNKVVKAHLQARLCNPTLLADNTRPHHILFEHPHGVRVCVVGIMGMDRFGLRGDVDTQRYTTGYSFRNNFL